MQPVHRDKKTTYHSADEDLKSTFRLVRHARPFRKLIKKRALPPQNVSF